MGRALIDALALLTAVLVLSPADGAATVTLAMVALVLATLVVAADRSPLLAARLVPVDRVRDREATSVPTQQITDPAHHPLRPRAPGLA